MLETLLLYLAGAVLFNLALFLVAFKLQSDKLTDISYALTFIAIAVAAFAGGGHGSFAILLLTMVVIWAVRLGGFLLRRVTKVGKDRRFDEMRANFWRFGQFWLLQGFSVWVLMIPTTIALQGDAVAVPASSLAGLVIFGTGLVIESIADWQKAVFKRQSAHRGTWITSGLWRYSRHPNYFGEILVWIGIYLYALPVLGVAPALVGLVSPLFISVLLIFISGIPPLEKAADRRWGSDRAYQAYKQQTSILLPLPPRHVKPSR